MSHRTTLNNLTKQQEGFYQRGLCLYTPSEITGEVKCPHEYFCLNKTNPREERLDRFAYSQIQKNNPFVRRTPPNPKSEVVCEKSLPLGIRQQLLLED